MATYVYAVILICALVEVAGAKSIDEIIMEAASNSSQMDMFQMSPSGKILMTLDLDIKMEVEQYLKLKGDQLVTRQKRKAVRSTDNHWEDCFVYYEVTDDFNSKEKRVIQGAIAEWQKYTCLVFKKAKSYNKDRIVISSGSGGCYSRLGKIGGVQEIGLSRGCVHKGVVIHEIGHAIGWIHEQARPDRDNYIKVNYRRIPQEWHSQFDKFPSDFINDYTVQYDYRSIMHYSGNAVAPRSIETLNPMYQNIIGQREGLSFRDVHLANVMYGCPKMKCPKFTSDCSRYGSDAFVFKMGGECRCVCPNDGDDKDGPIMPCENAHTSAATTTTTTRTTTTPAVTTTTTPPRTSTPEPAECLDLRPDCPELVKADKCKMDMEHMLMYCKRSCNFCEKGNMCMDLDSACPLLALGKFCDRPAFKTLMHMQCKKSCGFCTPVSPCKMQLQMGLGLDVQVSSGHKHSVIGTNVLGLLVLVWTLH